MSQHDLIGEQIRELSIRDVTRIIYQPDFDTLIHEETKPGLDNYEKGRFSLYVLVSEL